MLSEHTDTANGAIAEVQTRYELNVFASSITYPPHPRPAAGPSGSVSHVNADSLTNIRPAAFSTAGSAESSNVALSNVPPAAVRVDVTGFPAACRRTAAFRFRSSHRTRWRTQ